MLDAHVRGQSVFGLGHLPTQPADVPAQLDVVRLHVIFGVGFLFGKVTTSKTREASVAALPAGNVNKKRNDLILQLVYKKLV